MTNQNNYIITEGPSKGASVPLDSRDFQELVVSYMAALYDKDGHQIICGLVLSVQPGDDEWHEMLIVGNTPHNMEDFTFKGDRFVNINGWEVVL